MADTRRLLANQRQEAGDTTGALRELAEAERRLQEVARLKPADAAIPMRIAGMKAEEAESLMRSGQTVRATERLEEALQTLEDLLAREPKLVGLVDRSIAVAWKLGMTRRRMGDLPRAEQALRRSLSLANEWRDAAPEDIVRLRRHGLSLGSLGSVLSEAGRTAEALAVQQEALAGARSGEPHLRRYGGFGPQQRIRHADHVGSPPRGAARGAGDGGALRTDADTRLNGRAHAHGTRDGALVAGRDRVGAGKSRGGADCGATGGGVAARAQRG